jgi:cystathionine beta-lyase/cystathionine gamma-synthase
VPRRPRRGSSKAGEDEYIYARYGNPTVRMFEERIAALEGAEDAFATASGMAAVNGALMSMLKAGDHVVAARALFGSCLYILEDILPRYGVEVTFVDGTDLAAWEAAIRPDTAVVFFESMSNPTLGTDRHRGGVAAGPWGGRPWWSTTSSPRRSFRTPSGWAPTW